MSWNAETTRWLVELQGFTGAPDRDLKSIDIGLRIGPVFCATLAAVGTALGSPVLLLVLSGIALLGAVLEGNPFDVFYNHGLRHALKGPRLPDYRAPRRFACGVASVWLLVTVGLMIFGSMTAGQVMGWIMVGMAGIPVTTGFCVPSFVYRLVARTMPVRGQTEPAA
jgi:hypothetical protein